MFSYPIHRTQFLVATFGALALAWSPMVRAADIISSCDQFCDTSCPEPPGLCADAMGGACELSGGFDNSLTCCPADPNAFGCDGAGPITLKNGTNLDMHGDSIICGEATCNTAVDMIDNGSKVFNQEAAESKISGAFTVAVDCNLESNSQVDGITIIGATTGTLDCSKVQRNVILDDPNGGTHSFGIYRTAGIANADFIKDNYVRGYIWGIILNTTTTDVDVTNNVVDTSQGKTVSGIAIFGFPTGGAVSGNTILGSGQPDGFFRAAIGMQDPNSVDKVGNLCGLDHFQCQECMDADVCEVPMAPF